MSGKISPKTPERSAQPTEIQKGETMSIFKKSGEGFLAKLFKHKQVEELAEELAHTYACLKPSKASQKGVEVRFGVDFHQRISRFFVKNTYDKGGIDLRNIIAEN